MENDWQAAQHADELQRQHALIEALLEAERNGTPHEKVLFIADECGVRDLYRKHSELN